MVSQSGQQTNDTAGYSFGGDSEGMAQGQLSAGQTVNATTDAFQQALTTESLEVDRRKAPVRKLLCTDDTGVPDEGQQLVGFCHVRSIRGYKLEVILTYYL